MSLGREVTYLRTLGLGDVDLARAAGSADQSRGWPPSEPAGDWAARIGELVAIAERLEYVIDREKIALWLRTSIRELRWNTPLDLIGRGEAALVAQVIAAAEDAPPPSTTA